MYIKSAADVAVTIAALQNNDSTGSDDTIVFVMSYLVPVLLGIILFIVLMKRKQFQDSLKEVANRTGTIYDPGASFSTGQVTGEYRKRPIHFSSIVVRHGQNTARYIRLEITLRNECPHVLKLAHRSIVAKLNAVFERDAIQLHDVRFDPAFIVRSSDESLPEKVLSDRTCRDLLDFPKWQFSWQGDKATATKQVFLMPNMSVKRFVMLADILSEVADELDRQ